MAPARWKRDPIWRPFRQGPLAAAGERRHGLGGKQSNGCEDPRSCRGPPASPTRTYRPAVFPYTRFSRTVAATPVCPRSVGYDVTNMVAMQFRNLDGLGDVLDKLVAVGANQIGEIRFAVSNRETLLRQARRRAVADARSKAALYAEEAGVTLGRVIRISEVGSSSPHWEGRAAMVVADKSFGACTGDRGLARNSGVGDDKLCHRQAGLRADSIKWSPADLRLRDGRRIRRTSGGTLLRRTE